MVCLLRLSFLVFLQTTSPSVTLLVLAVRLTTESVFASEVGRHNVECTATRNRFRTRVRVKVRAGVRIGLRVRARVRVRVRSRTR